MRLKRIEIKNYKSCDKTTLDLNSNLTALIGINGCGKTNILSAIKLLRSLTDRVVLRTHSAESLFETTINATFESKEAEVNLKATFFYDVGSQTEEELALTRTEWRIPSLGSKKWIEIPADILIHYEAAPPDMQKRWPGFRMNRELDKYLTLKSSLPDSFFSNLVKVVDYIGSINYYSATQFSEPRKTPTSVEFEERESTSQYRGRRYDPHANIILDLIRLQKENPSKYQRFINLIGPTGLNLVDQIDFDEVEFSSEDVKVKSGGKIVTDKRKKLVIVPKITLGNKILSFNQLSDGTFKTIALLFYMIQKDNSLLLVEEPEVCVHHGLLRSILEIIKNESSCKQIIISTHSDYVLDQLVPENLVIVTRSNASGTIARGLNKSLSKNSYKALHKYLDEVGNLGDYWKEGGFDE